MSIAEKLSIIAENEKKVYDAGKKAEYDAFWDVYQEYGNKYNYGYAFSNIAWTDELLEKIKYPLKVKNGERKLNYNYTFYYNQAMTKTPLLYFSGVGSINGIFHQCTQLQEVNFEGEILVSLSLVHSPLLTLNCINRLIAGLTDYSGTTSTYTLTLHATAKAKLSESEIAVATEKGWTIA